MTKREMELRPVRARETTPFLLTWSQRVRRHRGGVVEFEDAPNRDESRVKRESDRRRPSKRRVKDGGSHVGNLHPLLAKASLARLSPGIKAKKMGIVVSIIHTAFKFHTPCEIGTVFLTYGPKKEEEGSKKVKETTLEVLKDVLSCVDAEERVIINEKHVFAWTYDDMTEILKIIMVGGKPFNMEHKLNEYKYIEPVKQKKRGLAPERNEAACKEVDELTKVGILQEVKYHTRVANPFMSLGNQHCETPTNSSEKLEVFGYIHQTFHQVGGGKTPNHNNRKTGREVHMGTCDLQIRSTPSDHFEGRQAVYKRNFHRLLYGIKDTSIFFPNHRACGNYEVHRKATSSKPTKMGRQSTSNHVGTQDPAKEQPERDSIHFNLRVKGNNFKGAEEAGTRVFVRVRRWRDFGFLESKSSTGAEGSAMTSDRNGKVAIASLTTMERGFALNPQESSAIYLPRLLPTLPWQIATLAIELGEHDIKLKGRNSVKGRILADFLAETPSVDNKHTEINKLEVTNKAQKLESIWKLYTDRASNSDGLGVGLMLVIHEGKEYTYALRFEFKATNNEAEYEALLASIRITY
nr:reverse transcriptase domain-containing protein [Tanacetum cinerariifolium]